MIRTLRCLVVITVLLASLLGGVVLANAQEEPQAEPQAEDAVEALSSCSGGIVKATRAVTQNTPTQIGENPAFVALPGASVGFTVPVGTLDTFVVTFSGECRLFNSSNDDWVEVEVRLDGVPMQPNDAGSSMAFCSANSWAMHSATFCRRVGSGSHTVQVFWRLRDFAPLGSLQGWLDDWTLLLLVSE
jgi:hypothetical protein